MLTAVIQRNRPAAAALVLLVATLSITLGMVAAGPRADAFVPPPVPIAIGETLAGPAAEVLGGTACVGTIVCGAVVGTAALGVAAYATRDHWLPTVKRLFSDTFAKDSGTGGKPSGACSVTAAITFDGSSKVTGSISWGGCYQYVTGQNIVATRLQCKSKATGQITTSTRAYNAPASTDGNNGTLRLKAPPYTGQSQGTGVRNFDPWSPCPTDFTAVSGTLVFAHDAGGTIAYSNGIDFGTAVDEPDVSQTSTVHCVGGAAGSGADVTRTQTGHPDQILVPSCRAAYPGSVPTRFAATGGRAGAETGLLDLPLLNPTTKYPDCFDANGAFKASCVVRVWINGAPCTVGASHCDKWETADDDFGDKVECRFGPYPVQLDDCDLLKNQYRTDTKVKTLTTTDPKTGAAADPSTVPGASTGASTGTSTGQSTFPSTGTNPDAGTSPGAGGAPEPSESSESNTKNCWGSGWSWNPISWVYVPVRCALKWAFVPPPGTFTLTDVATQFSARPPGSVVVEVGGLLKSTFGAYSSSNGCAPVGFGSQSGRALEVDCNGLQGSGVGRALYSLAGVAVIVGAGIACWRIVAGAVDR